MFDDSLLDDPEVIYSSARLEQLAVTGARLRCEPMERVGGVAQELADAHPRSMLVLGAEARLIRALVERRSPVPIVAWSMTTLPGWVGPLDLVVVLAGSDLRWLPTCIEASHRGAWLLVVAPCDSAILDEFSSASMLLTNNDEPLVAALLASQVLQHLGLGPDINLDLVADVLDGVAQACGPRHSLGVNPAKNLACGLADTVPLIWGGSNLAARAGRRVAEALREATQTPALAADAAALIPLIEGFCRPNLFADPFEDTETGLGFCLLIFDDGNHQDQALDLVRLGESRAMRVETICHDQGYPVLRYVGLLHQGLFAAAYLELATVDGETRNR